MGAIPPAQPHPWTDAQLVLLLRMVRDLAQLAAFPDDGVQRDPGLQLALGEIAGRAERALDGHAEASR